MNPDNPSVKEAADDLVNEAIRRFRIPYSEDIRISIVNTERWMDYRAGQVLANECERLRKKINNLNNKLRRTRLMK